MSQLKMNLPGAQVAMGPQMNIYTGLLFLAALALVAAVAIVWQVGASLSPDAMPWTLQDPNNIKLSQ